MKKDVIVSPKDTDLGYKDFEGLNHDGNQKLIEEET